MILFSFILEFSSISNILHIKSVDNVVANKKLEFIVHKQKDIAETMNNYNMELQRLPDSKIQLRKKYLNELEKLRQEKNNINKQYEEMLASSGEKIEKRSAIANTADYIGVDEKQIIKIIAVGICVLLNTLYVVLIFTGIRLYELNKRE
jgi:hypothetical protein